MCQYHIESHLTRNGRCPDFPRGPHRSPARDRTFPTSCMLTQRFYQTRDNRRSRFSISFSISQYGRRHGNAKRALTTTTLRLRAAADFSKSRISLTPRNYAFHDIVTRNSASVALSLLLLLSSRVSSRLVARSGGYVRFIFRNYISKRKCTLSNETFLPSYTLPHTLNAPYFNLKTEENACS